MTYNYENLLDEHFQMLCQAILTEIHSHVRSYPVGMPDGGRDALAIDLATGASLVYQVKFARNPAKIKDPLKWIKAAIDGELLKVKKLIERGASEYCLITNLSGTSHLDVGSIDKVDAYLKQHISIPAFVMWREDLDARLAPNFDLKLAFPAVLSGADIPRLLWEQQVSRTSSKARAKALKAYMSYQHEQDSNVRFKQADLPSSSLLDIFVDVPLTMARGKGSWAKKANQDFLRFAESVLRQRGLELVPVHSAEGSPTFVVEQDGDLTALVMRDETAMQWQKVQVGGAEILLDNEFTLANPLLLLEGAPGQGKSTLTQYLAQVHRSRVLNTPDVTKLPKTASGSSLQFPFRLELRDISEWLEGINPWAKEPDSRHDLPKTLDGAIAGQVARYSGGYSFTVEDLHAVIGETPTLLLLDGLDEVADLTARRKVVEAVVEGTQRLKSLAKRLTVLVTSRPTAVPTAPSLPRDKFAALALDAIDEVLALDYTDRWARARNLPEKDRQEVRSILSEKMRAPHMAELAKNTMQLSILLSLIHHRGSSLPDKRTELYFTYVDTFLNRESEKSEIVRKYRRLLLDIHCYLGYYLHGMAEKKGTTGRIRINELSRLLSDYLVSEGRSAQLVNELLVGTVERVVALVSRVEGTYEFEVQPLREYFAARYLYETAAYSPTGREAGGTKPDRFDALARNYYWQNVTRFFAGCFSKGELLDLADRINHLIYADDLTYSPYPRTLGLFLLQDSVFSQNPKATGEVVRAVFDSVGLKYIASTKSHQDGTDIDTQFELSEDCGRAELAEICWNRIREATGLTSAISDVCRLLIRHMETASLETAWRRELQKRKGERRRYWIQVGRALNLSPSMAITDIAADLGDSDDLELSRRLGMCIRAGMPVSAMSISELKIALKGLLDYPLGRGPVLYGATRITKFAELSSPMLWSAKLRRQYTRHLVTEAEVPTAVDSPNSTLSAVDEFNECAREMFLDPTSTDDINSWLTLISSLEKVVGQTHASIELGVMSGAISAADERGAGVKSLFDDAPLPHRVRNARRRASQVDWWRAETMRISSHEDRFLWLLAWWAWAQPETLLALLPEADSLIRQLDERQSSALMNAAQRANRYSPRARKPLPSDRVISALQRKSPTLIAICSSRISPEVAQASLVPKLLRPKQLGLASAASNVIEVEYSKSRISDVEFVQWVSSAYRRLAVKHYDGNLVPRALKTAAIRRTVLDDPWIFPDEFFYAVLLRGNMRKDRVKPIMEIAENDSWFPKE